MYVILKISNLKTYRPQMFLLDLTCFSTHFPKCPSQEVEETFWSRNDVEWWGHSATFFKVGNPQLAASKLPLDVRLLL